MVKFSKPSVRKPPKVGEWALIMATGEKGIVEKVMDGGERLYLRIPSTTDWPFPRWVHIPYEKVQRVRPPKPPKPELPTEEALL